MIKNEKVVKDKDFAITRSADEERKLSFKNHLCVGCGICESTCPVSAINLEEIGAISRNRFDTYFSGHDKIAQNVYVDKKHTKLEINHEKCVLCGMCSGLCPADALNLTIDNVPISEIDAYPSYLSFAKIDDNECIYCQRCQVACPRDAITIERTLPTRADLVTGEIEVNEDECIYCGICDEMCPAEAIVVDNETGKESIIIDKDKCVYCLICKRSCPTNAIKALCRSCSYGEYDLDPKDAVVKGNSIIDDELCIKCGWCEGVCPTEAAKVQQSFKGTLDINQDKCKACGACVDVCPCNVLAFPISDAPGQRLDHVTKTEDYCIHCGACARTCPNGALTVKVTNINCTPTNSITWNQALDAIKN